MPSYYARHGALSAHTREAYRRYGASPRTLDERVSFYIDYLKDVVPSEVSVIHIPSHRNVFDLGSEGGERKEEIQLYCDGGIFITCVVSMAYHYGPTEDVTGALAYEHWRQGFFVRDRNTAWRAAVCMRGIRFFSSDHGRDWVSDGDFNPVTEARYVAEFLQEEYERSRRR